MKVLIVGSGGREHALAWKVAQSPNIRQVFVAPGNAGTSSEKRVKNVPLSAEDIPGLLHFAEVQNIDLTIVGPEAPLAHGIVDQFQKAGKRCFGPSAAAARLEASKTYAKEFLSRWNIPTARYATFTELEPALEYVRNHDIPVVIKADGLAAGKGVVVATSFSEAENAVRDMLDRKVFGSAGSRVVIEEFLVGEEASFIALCDGLHVLPLASSQDHKARDDGDKGPNTGGMGAYSPAPILDGVVEKLALEQILLPTIRGLAAEGTPYVGFLYVGLMIDAERKPKVLEYNCRCGDPETQPILMRLQSDLIDLCEAAMESKLDRIHADWDPRPALGVVLAAGGYPDSYSKGNVIHGLDLPPLPNTKVFHAGTAFQEGEIVTQGGRVLCVCALGNSILEAQSHAYEAIEQISWSGIYFRKDIGHRAVKRSIV